MRPIVTAALNGEEWATPDKPHIPLTPDEIATAAIEAAEACVVIGHIHLREEDEAPANNVARYRQVSKLIWARSEGILDCSTDLRRPVEVLGEAKVLTSLTYSPNDFRRAMAMGNLGALDVAAFITHHQPENSGDAFRESEAGMDHVKVMLEVGA
jgi:uncharacterized protein (DUF849 family)